MTAAVTRPDAATQLARARVAIAQAILGAAPSPGDIVIGAVVLRPHQRDAVARLRRALDATGGALLADDAGLGKTYVALALAREARAPLLVLPASLRATWRQAMARTGVAMPMVTHEALSRRSHEVGGPSPDLVVVDEAHHARNPATRRWRALAALTRGAHVLLLSATPVHNRREDLSALLALFLGVCARDASDALLARCIVRRERDDPGTAGGALPVVAPVRLLPLAHDDSVLDGIVALPPPLGEADAPGAGALLVHALLRQWASSEGALRSALTRRLARAAGLEAALREGFRPDRAELARWAVADDAVQLPFAALLAPPEPRADALLGAVVRHAAAVRDVLARLDGRADGHGRDAERAVRLLEVRARHAGERIIAFTSYAGTVRALWRALRGVAGVAALTSRGGAVAGGPVTRADVLRRFAPLAQGCAPPSKAEAVSLLLATDLASEGVNLQDASVVVHLDLPWTPARLEQRVGRVARIGAVRDVVHVYAMMPPAAAERVLALEARLRRKLAAAARAVGVAGAIVPPIGWRAGGVQPDAAPAASGDSAPRIAERTRRRLLAWRAPAEDTETPANALPAEDAPLVAAVRGESNGALALIDSADGARLLAVDAGVASVVPESVARVVRSVDEGEPCAVHAGALRAAVALLERWLRAERAARVAAVDEVPAAALRRQAALHAASALARAPREGRTQAARDAAGVLRTVVGARGAGAESAARAALAAGDVGRLAPSHPMSIPETTDGVAGDRGAVDRVRVVVLVLARPLPP